jgi:uncharacterized membrane protein YedE/YeeE
MTQIIALAAGLVFGIGLIFGGMADPSKVLGFLDLAGHWDPSLAFVMGGAVMVALGGFAIARHRRHSFLGGPMVLPITRGMDRRLILGSLLFGVGWGLSGICPGPALVLIGQGIAKAWIFGAAMIAGMGLFTILDR